MRLFWVISGLLSLGLGVVGVVLPLLPTVPFILLAGFCFARSSERLHGWLLEHRHFGPMIDDWHTRGAISPRVKRLSTLSVIGVIAISYLIGLRTLILIVQAVVLCAVMLFIWTRPIG